MSILTFPSAAAIALVKQVLNPLLTLLIGLTPLLVKPHVLTALLAIRARISRLRLSAVFAGLTIGGEMFQFRSPPASALARPPSEVVEIRVIQNTSLDPNVGKMDFWKEIWQFCMFFHWQLIFFERNCETNAINFKIYKNSKTQHF